MSTTTKNPPPKAPARGLGKGLSALMSESYSAAPEAEVKGGTDVSMRDGAALTPVAAGYPARQVPAARTISTSGRCWSWPNPSGKTAWFSRFWCGTSSGGKYEIIAGERRWRAASMAGLSTNTRHHAHTRRQESAGNSPG